ADEPIIRIGHRLGGHNLNSPTIATVRAIDAASIYDLRPSDLQTRNNEECRRPREAIGITSTGPRRLGECVAAPVAREPKAVNPEVFLPVGLPAPACRPALASGAT